MLLCKAIKFCPNQLADLLRFLFIEDSLKIGKGLELVSRPHLSQKFLIKLFSKMLFLFHAWEFDDVIPFEYLES